MMALAGTPVTCESGHVICALARDIDVGVPHRTTDFRDFRVPEPREGDPIKDIACPHCGSRWIRLRDGGVHVHLEGRLGPVWMP